MTFVRANPTCVSKEFNPVPEFLSAMTSHLHKAFEGTAKSTDKIEKERNPKISQNTSHSCETHTPNLSNSKLQFQKIALWRLSSSIQGHMSPNTEF